MMTPERRAKRAASCGEPRPLDPDARRFLEAARAPAPAGSEARGWTRLEASISPRGHEPVSGWGSPALLPRAAWAGAVAFVGVLLWSAPWLSRLEEPVRWVEGAVQTVPADEERALSMGERARVLLEGPARLRVRRWGPNGEAHLELEEGAVKSWVQPTSAGALYVVASGAWRVTSLGTVFRVEARDDGGINVRLSEGRLRVEGPQVEEILGAPSERIYRLPASKPPEEPSTPTLGSTRRVNTPKKVARRVDRRTRAAPRPRGQKPRSPPASALRSPPGSSPRSPPASALRSPPGSSPRAPLLLSPPASPPFPIVETFRPPAGAKTEDPAEDPAREDPLEVVASLVEQSRFEEAQLHLQEHLSEHESPRSAWLRLRIMVGLGRSRDVVDQATDYLKRWMPSPTRRRELIYWRAESLRRLNRLQEASEDFAVVAETRLDRDDRTEDALWSLAWCQARTGAYERARQTVEGYLERFPQGRFAEAARAWLRP